MTFSGVIQVRIYVSCPQQVYSACALSKQTEKIPIVPGLISHLVRKPRMSYLIIRSVQMVKALSR